mmetsp:Transcript_6893/g.10908  ORF Transcript_6893/g.10908 Transcript_6893/m.10908 type:complete len:310 (-) Transcript_6893:89-1018(-)
MPPFLCSNNHDSVDILNVKNSVKKSCRSQDIDYKSMADRSLAITPHENDILMGRGGKNNQHVGNEKLRGMARLHSANYQVASKKGKSFISRQLVKQVRLLGPPGRFLKKDNATGVWEDVGDDVAREKASQVLRDAVSFSVSPQQSESMEVQHPCAHTPNETFSDTRRVASAPPIVKAASRRRHWEEMNYTTPPHYHHQPNMITPAFCHEFSLSQHSPRTKRQRYHTNTWDKQSASTSYQASTQARYSSQAEYRRSLPTSPIVHSRPRPDKQASQSHTPLDEFELFNGELLNSDDEGADNDSKLSKKRVE